MVLTPRDPRPALSLALIVSVLGFQPATGQEASGSPHGELSIPCATCHTASSWRPARIQRSFDHGRFGFLLDGSHAATNCTSCHQVPEFRQVQRICLGCHQDVHQAEFGSACARCHNTRSFSDRSDLARTHALTRFPLDGAHRAADCRACHSASAGGGLAFSSAPTECVACHQQDVGRTTNPPHEAAGFPIDCVACHTSLSWMGAQFDHRATDFPLDGAHLAASCQQCHAAGLYAGTPASCLSCHQAQFDRANPPHKAAGFVGACTDCHTTVSWAGAGFGHGATQFPLTGAHLAVPCQQCHSDGIYDGKPTTCVSCHQPDYAGTSNPPHQAAAFSTDCAACHTTATWLGATFDHDGRYFPIYSGKHNGKWQSNCGTCHTNPAAYAVFSCLTCHEHRQSDMDDKHKNEPGYQFTSQACYSCHPSGRKP